MTTARARRKRLTRAYFAAEGAIALFAVLFITVGLSYLIEPSAVGQSFVPPYPFDYGINGFYVIGGLAILWGFLDRRVGIEVAGHLILAPVLLLNAMFAVSALGVHRQGFLAVVFALWSGFRALGLYWHWREVG